MFVRNSAKDRHKEDKLVKHWLDPIWLKHIDKGVYKLKKPSTSRTLKNPVMITGKRNSSKS